MSRGSARGPRGPGPLRCSWNPNDSEPSDMSAGGRFPPTSALRDRCHPARFRPDRENFRMSIRVAQRLGVRVSPEAIAVPGHAAFHWLRPWVELAKPGVTRLVLITTLFGGLVAPGRLPLARALFTLLGTWLVVAAANALNMVYEADADALMSRTQDRPLPRGRLSPAAVV